MHGEALSTRNSLKLKSFRLVLARTTPCCFPSQAPQSRTASPCGFHRILHMQHDVSVQKKSCSCLQISSLQRASCAQVIAKREQVAYTSNWLFQARPAWQGPCLLVSANYNGACNSTSVLCDSYTYVMSSTSCGSDVYNAQNVCDM